MQIGNYAILFTIETEAVTVYICSVFIFVLLPQVDKNILMQL